MSPSPSSPHNRPNRSKQSPNSMARLRIGIYGSGGAPYHHAALIALWGGTPEIVSAEHIRHGELVGFDVLIMPGGGLHAMRGLLEPLGSEGAKHIRLWVEQGGMYIGSCAGSFLPAIVNPSFWKSNPEAREMCMVAACPVNSENGSWEGLTSPGVGVVDVEVTNTQHWLAAGLPHLFPIVHYNGPMFTPTPYQQPPELGHALGSATSVVTFKAATQRFTSGEAFFDSTATPDLFQKGVQEGALCALVSSYGEGKVVLFGSHPEFGFNAIQLGWDKSSLLLKNALTYKATKINREGSPRHLEPSCHEPLDRSNIAAIIQDADLAGARLSALAKRPLGKWLEPECAPAFMGLSPREVWRKSLSEGTGVLTRSARYLSRLTEEKPEALTPYQSWLDTEVPKGQDYGFAGVKQLLAHVLELVRRADTILDNESPFCLSEPYGNWYEHPYQLLAGSYLSASGLAASVGLASTVLGTLGGFREPPPIPLKATQS